MVGKKVNASGEINILIFCESRIDVVVFVCCLNLSTTLTINNPFYHTRTLAYVALSGFNKPRDISTGAILNTRCGFLRPTIRAEGQIDTLLSINHTWIGTIRTTLIGQDVQATKVKEHAIFKRTNRF